jgi:pimeloyl-ACP methyl ester carboxylesterase
VTPAAAQSAPATFVLVHGAWAGSWIWQRLIPQLRVAGYAVYASTATGLGDRSHLATPAIDLALHITDVVKLLEFEDLHDVTLVGWSYGGMIISGVAEQVPERLAQLIYLDADRPANGESGWDAELYSPDARAADVASGVQAGVPGFITIDPYRDWIRSLVPNPADQAWLFAKFTPQALPTYSQPLTLGNPAAAALPRAFIFCTQGKSTPDVDHTVRSRQQVHADPQWRYRELAETHFAAVNNPAATAAALLSLV